MQGKGGVEQAIGEPPARGIKKAGLGSTLLRLLHMYIHSALCPFRRQLYTGTSAEGGGGGGGGGPVRGIKRAGGALLGLPPQLRVAGACELILQKFYKVLAEACQFLPQAACGGASGRSFPPLSIPVRTHIPEKVGEAIEGLLGLLGWSLSLGLLLLGWLVLRLPAPPQVVPVKPTRPAIPLHGTNFLFEEASDPEGFRLE